MTDIPADIDWVEDICAANLGTVAQIDNKLYAIGGFQVLRDTSDPNSPGVNLANSHLHTIDLSGAVNLEKASASSFITAARLPARVPRTMWGNLFAHKGQLHYFGGLQVPQPIYLEDGTYSLAARPEIRDGVWTYIVQEGAWVNSVSGKRMTTGLGADVLGQSAKAEDMASEQAYLYGGAVWTEPYMIGNRTVGNGTAFRELRDLLLPQPVDVADTDSAVEADEYPIDTVTTKTVASASARPAVQATMVFLEGMGGEGVLVLMGGSSLGQYASLQEVHVYDIASKTWFTQPTSPDGTTFPDDRTEGCAVAAKAPDSSSYNIYLYGGKKPNAAGETPEFLGLGEVWVLSIPSFKWVRSNADFAITRVGHTCHRIQEKYMVTYRGLGPTPCDKYGGLQIYDMNKMEWTTALDKDSTYAVPELVYKAIGGDKTGGATTVTPKGGWSDSQLKSIFKVPTSNHTSTPTGTTTSTPSATSTNPPSTTSEPSTTPHTSTAIKIAVPIAVILLLLFLLAAFLLHRRRRRRASNARLLELPPAGTHHDHDAHSQWPATSSSAEQEYYGELASPLKYEPGMGGRSELESNHPPAYELPVMEEGQGRKRESVAAMEFAGQGTGQDVRHSGYNA